MQCSQCRRRLLPSIAHLDAHRTAAVRVEVNVIGTSHTSRQRPTYGKHEARLCGLKELCRHKKPRVSGLHAYLPSLNSFGCSYRASGALGLLLTPTLVLVPEAYTGVMENHGNTRLSCCPVRFVDNPAASPAPRTPPPQPSNHLIRFVRCALHRYIHTYR